MSPWCHFRFAALCLAVFAGAGCSDASRSDDTGASTPTTVSPTVSSPLAVSPPDNAPPSDRTTETDTPAHSQTDSGPARNTIEAAAPEVPPGSNPVLLADDPVDNEDPASSLTAYETPADSIPRSTALLESKDQYRDWPQFRGADGQGHGSASGLPVRWNEKKNIRWKVPIRGTGWSSPVIADNKIWLTTAVVPEKSLRVVCLDADTGAILHDVEVFRKETLGKIHPKNSHASPTPLLIGDRCYVHFGSHGTAALDTEGEIMWTTELKYYHHHGPASSPVLVDGALFIACDGLAGPFYDDRKISGVTDPQFVVALDAATGRERWRSKRDGAHSYATPLVIKVEGRTQVVSPGGHAVTAYDPSTGEEIWRCNYGQGYSVVPRPVFGLGLVFICTGYDSPMLLAIRPTGHGDVTNSHVAWKSNQAVPLNPSPILIGDELYTISDQGVASCLDAKTGKIHWRRRLGGNHSTSPLFADGKLFFLDEVGTTHVLAPGTTCKILAKNLVRGKTLASLAASGSALYLRTDSHLYRIEETGVKSSDSDDDPQAE
jgi:outer membrane protein assembly factor BamB